MSALFRVLEVFRPQSRKGPILVGRYPSGDITIGTRLVSVDNAEHLAEVIAIDLTTDNFPAENRIAIIVKPDLGTAFRAGAEFRIVTSDKSGASSPTPSQPTNYNTMGRIHSFALRILKASWGIAIDLQARISVQDVAPAYAIRAGARTWLVVTAASSPENVHNLTKGLEMVSEAMEGALTAGQIVIDVLRADYVPTDYQPEAMAPAIIGLMCEVLELNELQIDVSFDRRANRYCFTYK